MKKTKVALPSGHQSFGLAGLSPAVTAKLELCLGKTQFNSSDKKTKEISIY